MWFTILEFVIMVVLILIGVPVFCSIGIGCFFYFLATGVPLVIIPERLAFGVSNFSLLAIPFFILAGELMNYSGVTKKLINFANLFVGHLRGGLGYVVVIVNMIMAGVSGSAPADASAAGSVMIPAMKKERFDAGYAVALNAAAATVGPIIPPSILMVIIGLISDISIGRLFLGGAIPGILMGGALLIANYLISKKRKYPTSSKTANRLSYLRTFLSAIPALIAPLIIIGGIVLGVATVTEVGILADAYVLFLGTIVYKKIRIKDIPKIFLKVGIFSAVIMVIFGAASVLSWSIANEQIGMKAAQFFSTVVTRRIFVLLIINGFFLFIGCIMDPLPALMIFFPVFLPIATQAGIDPVHFGVMIVLNSMLGMLTPPVGGLLYLTCKLGEVPFDEGVKEVLPLFLMLVGVLMLVSFFPQLSLWIPNSIMGK